MMRSQIEKFMCEFGGDLIAAPEEIKKGQANNGIFFHKIRARGEILSIIEKITTNQHEIEFSRKFDWTTFGPKNLAVIENNDQCHIFMEFLPNIPEEKKPTEELAIAIVECLRSMQASINKDAVRKAPPRWRLVHTLSKHEGLSNRKWLREALSDMRGRYEGLRQGVGHHDLFLENISVSRVDGKLLCKFFDFGHAGCETLGADLHPYTYNLTNLSPKFGEKASSDFFNALMDNFSSTFSVPVPECLFAARVHRLSRFAYGAVQRQRTDSLEKAQGLIDLIRNDF